jgi:DNA-nicking Smr family endonuclease
MLESEAKAQKAEKVAKYKDVLAEKKIPMEMIDYFLTDEEETTNTRIDNFSTYVNDMVNYNVKEKIASGSYTPPGENGSGDLTVDDVAKMMM